MHVLMFLIVVAVVTGALLIVSAPSKRTRAVSRYYERAPIHTNGRRAA
jgi:hypothetical protein